VYYAKKRGTGEIVAAGKASRWGSYRCPTCNVEVLLRSGEERVAHFAHKPGQGKPECEQFHPSEDLRHLWYNTPDAYQGPAIDPLRLSIELEPDYDSRRGPRKWVLRLTVPKSPDEHGLVQIDCGGGDAKKIALSKLVLGTQTYLADPAAPDFGANWVSPEVRTPYRAAIEHRIPGLSSRVANVFGASRLKLKPQSNVLCWGESYYFVWPADRPIAVPASILNHVLAVNRDWSCCLIGLPHKADAEIAAWLGQTCDLPIVRSKREWALIYPPPYAVDDDGNLQVSSAAQLLLAIRPTHGDGGSAGKVNCTAGQVSAFTTLTGTDQHFIEITIPEHTTQKPVHLTWDDASLATVIAKPYPAAASEPAILLEFEGAGVTESAPLHSVSCQELLGLVRLAQRRLFGVRAHPLLRGQLCWRRNGQFEWEREELVFSNAATHSPDSSVRLTAQRIDRINTTLQDRSIDVDLEFGAFGRFYASAVPQEGWRPAAFHIRRDLRQRIEWLCKVSGAFATSQHRPVGLLDDKALLLHFSGISVPAALAAHWRALDHELRTAAKAISAERRPDTRAEREDTHSVARPKRFNGVFRRDTCCRDATSGALLAEHRWFPENEPGRNCEAKGSPRKKTDSIRRARSRLSRSLFDMALVDRREFPERPICPRTN